MVSQNLSRSHRHTMGIQRLVVSGLPSWTVLLLSNLDYVLRLGLRLSTLKREFTVIWRQLAISLKIEFTELTAALPHEVVTTLSKTN